MPEQKQYLAMMIQCLEKKIGILDSLMIKNAEQKSLVDQDEIDMEAFSANVDDKAELIEQLGRLDEGFEALYGRVREVLLTQRKDYAPQIKRLQQLITMITDRSIGIQAAELRNKQEIEKHFSLLHKNVKDSKISSKAAANYYKSMSNAHVVEPRSIDIRSNQYKK